ncbi:MULTISPECIES: DoxX family membrane protein [unclassified Polaribacter]|uniref:DoxX family membrane protein n=1 Tax=unclassified Polaribacter TaxID=196858 RepID=UPI0011BFBFCC|nr:MULTISPECIES: DoxX family membrane protein [unclassified Polaribacter]TXD53905.1 DoxX family membrane protein [Polaribacter sp. IC063]TXD58525.1 DoxX family membrane protein [Polaribacter sp. IC066]
MNAKLFLFLRIFFGIFLVFFGLDHFLNYIPFPEMAPEANAYFQNLLSTYAMQLVGVVEVTAGLAFIFNKFGALMALILMSVSINAVLFHLSLDPAKIYGALVLLVLNIIFLYAYRKKYNTLLTAV